MFDQHFNQCPPTHNCKTDYLLLTAYYSLLTAYYLVLTVYYLLLTAYYSLRTTYRIHPHYLLLSLTMSPTANPYRPPPNGERRTNRRSPPSAIMCINHPPTSLHADPSRPTHPPSPRWTAEPAESSLSPETIYTSPTSSSTSLEAEPTLSLEKIYTCPTSSSTSLEPGICASRSFPMSIRSPLHHEAHVFHPPANACRPLHLSVGPSPLSSSVA